MDDFALATVAAPPDKAGGPPPQVLRATGQPPAWTFTDRAQKSGLLPSMGNIGDCYDNALIEAFWSRMQVELLNTRRWKTRVELANAIFEYIEVFHNRPPTLLEPQDADTD
jgi:transposase InsO family protein